MCDITNVFYADAVLKKKHLLTVIKEVEYIVTTQLTCSLERTTIEKYVDWPGRSEAPNSTRKPAATTTRN